MMDRARRLCRRLFHHVYHRYALRQIAKPTTRVLGHTLVTDPQVFHPVYFLSTGLFLAYLGERQLAGKRLLDMGTGSGIVGIFAASRGAAVTSCDVNPHAVRLAAENARRNAAPVEVVESNLFSALAGRVFDLICFNVPFYAQAATTPFESALYAGPAFETIREFARGCGDALARDGEVVIIFSEDSGRDTVLSFFVAADLVAVEERVATKYFERFHIVRFRRAASAPAAQQHR
jgi:release factor glutamine methyltransferase